MMKIVVLALATIPLVAAPLAQPPNRSAKLAVYAAVELAVRDHEPRPCDQPLHFVRVSQPAAAVSFWTGMAPRIVTAEAPGAQDDGDPFDDELIRSTVRRWIAGQPATV